MSLSKFQLYLTMFESDRFNSVVTNSVYQVEYMLVKFDHDKKKARVLLDAERVLNILQEQERRKPK